MRRSSVTKIRNILEDCQAEVCKETNTENLKSENNSMRLKHFIYGFVRILKNHSKKVKNSRFAIFIRHATAFFDIHRLIFALKQNIKGFYFTFSYVPEGCSFS